ncbi:hypothetical protein AFB00_10110 [Pseudonocardia sp. HH130630-07]|nr:hypothetical protein AFB00_10110 [Pseudonocardia sp. HH130630-07]
MGALLRAARGDAGLTQTAVVEATSLSQAALSRIERGDGLPALDDDRDQVAELVTVYRLGDTDPELATWLRDVVEELHDRREEKRVVVVRGSNIMAMQRRFTREEQASTRIRAWSQGLILGQLQSPAYTAAVLGLPEDSPEVRQRRERYAGAPRNRLRQYDVLLAETVARWPLVDDTAMLDQLDDLITTSQLPNVDLRWLPLGVRLERLPLLPAFHVYDDRMVIWSQIDGSATLTAPEDVARYVAEFERLQAVALAGDEARSAIAEIASEFR